MPKFSIIVPLHNSADFCRKCLDSVKFQTYTDYELIIVCDKCVDNTADGKIAVSNPKHEIIGSATVSEH